MISEGGYNDEDLRARIEANPQAEVVLAETGKSFIFETTAMRVETTIKDMAYGEGSNVYFEKLAISLKIFPKEGVDLKIGEMDIPDSHKS